MTDLARLRRHFDASPGVRAYLRAVRRQRAAARPGFALAAGLATLAAMLAH